MAKTQSKVVLVTPAMAENWLMHSLFERQRKIASWQVLRLSIEMQNGRFIAGTQIHFGVLDGKNKLLNGQHTLAAIVKFGKPVELTILSTTVENVDHLGLLYGRHDRHRGRTPHDAFAGMALAEKLELSEPEINSFATGLRHVVNDFRRLSVTTNVEIATSPDYLSAKMEEWSKVARCYFDAVRDARIGLKAAFRRGPVVAIGLATFKHQEEKAKEFWCGAASDDGLLKYDPRRVLNNFLLANSSSHGDVLTYMRNIAGAWNHFFQQEELQFLRPSGMGKLGVTILGTPYKARHRAGAAVENDDDEKPKASRPVQGELGDVRL